MAKYQSPFALFKALDLDDDDLSPEGLKKLQKRLLLELDMVGGVSLRINNASLSKEDILKLSERLQAEAGNMQFHQRLADFPRLVELLEGRRFDPEREASLALDDQFYNDVLLSQEFRAFLSPYLGPVILPLLKKSIIARDFNRHGIVWLHLGETLTGEERAAFIDRLSHSLNGIVEEIARLEKNAVPLDKSAWTFLSGRPFYYYLNQLPEELSSFRNLFAYAVNDLVVAYQHKELNWCHYVMQGLLNLRTEGEIQTLIKENAQILKDNFKRRSKDNDGCFQGLGRGIGGVVVLIILFRVILSGATCLKDDDAGSGYNYYSNNKLTTINSIHHLTHWSRMRNVAGTTEYAHQNGGLENDSLIIAYPSAPVYEAFYAAYNDSINLPGSYPVMVKNFSKYHAVIFVIGSAGSSNFVLPSGRQRKIYLKSKDALTCYAGLEWHPEYSIREKSNLQADEKFKGLFGILPANGAEQMSYFYPFNKTNEPGFGLQPQLQRDAGRRQLEQDSKVGEAQAAFELHMVGEDAVEIRSSSGFTFSKTFMY